METGMAGLLADLERAWAGDVDRLVPLYAGPCRFEDKALGLVHHRHAGIREVFAFTVSMMPDFRVVYGEHVLGAEAGAAQWVFAGAFRGRFAGRIYPATPVRIEGVSFMTFAGDRILTNTDYWSLASLSEQLDAGMAM
jgi:hypothetical protein